MGLNGVAGVIKLKAAEARSASLIIAKRGLPAHPSLRLRFGSSFADRVSKNVNQFYVFRIPFESH